MGGGREVGRKGEVERGRTREWRKKEEKGRGMKEEGKQGRKK